MHAQNIRWQRKQLLKLLEYGMKEGIGEDFGEAVKRESEY